MEKVNKMKEILSNLMEKDYPAFIKAIVSIEKDIRDEDTLNYIFDRYLKEDFNILNDEIDYLNGRRNEMKKYDNGKLINKLEDMFGEFTNYTFNEPVTLSEIENLLNVEMSKEKWNRNRRFNEYGTTDVTVSIKTFSEEHQEDIDVVLILEVDENDKITQIVGYDEEPGIEAEVNDDEWDLEM